MNLKDTDAVVWAWRPMADNTEINYRFARTKTKEGFYITAPDRFTWVLKTGLDDNCVIEIQFPENFHIGSISEDVSRMVINEKVQNIFLQTGLIHSVFEYVRIVMSSLIVDKNPLAGEVLLIKHNIDYMARKIEDRLGLEARFKKGNKQAESIEDFYKKGHAITEELWHKLPFINNSSIIINPSKCDNCQFCVWDTTGADEYPQNTMDANCTKDHWNGIGPPSENTIEYNSVWDNCEDFQEKLKE